MNYNKKKYVCKFLRWLYKGYLHLQDKDYSKSLNMIVIIKLVSNSNDSYILMQEIRTQISQELVKQLSMMAAENDKSIWSKKQLNYLLNLTCQNTNLLNYEYFDGKQLHQDCIDAAIELFAKECHKGEDAAYNVVGLFLKHQIQHPGCHISLNALWTIIKKEASVLNVIKKQYFDAIIRMIEETWKSLEESAKLKLLQKNKNHPIRQDVISRMIKQLSSLPKPTRRQERQKTEAFGKIPPLIVPTINTITSSRFDLNQSIGTGLQQFEKLAVSLGQAAVGIQLGTLMNKRRSQQVKLFEDSEQYRRSLSQNSMERDPLPTPRDLAMTQVQSQRDAVQTNICPKDCKKVILIFCNILYKVLLKDLQCGQYQNKNTWLNKIFDIVLSGTFQNFNREINNYNKDKQDLLPKQQIFSALFNLSALYSQQIHLHIIMIKNFHHSEGSNQGSYYEINDQLLRSMKIEKKKINKKIISKLGLTSLSSSQLQSLKINLNQFLSIWRLNFMKVVQYYSVTDSVFFQLETSLLNILANYLKHSESRISSYEVIQTIFDLLLFVKRQIIQLSLPFLQDRVTSSPNLSQTNFNKKQYQNDYFPPLIYSHSELIGGFLNVLANLDISNRFVQRLINNCFVRCEQFTELIKLYSIHIFRLQNYDLILKLLDYHRHFIKTFYERWVKYKDVKPIKILFKSTIHLFLPKNGLVTSYFQSNENQIAALLRNKHTLNKQQSRYVVFFSQVVRFCKDVFKYPSQINPLLQDTTIVSFYIRFSFLNFIKLYSFLTERQLKSLREQQLLNSPNPNNSNTHYNHMLLKSFLGVMRSLASVRTDDLSRKIFHYRILEFFVRQLQLEFQTNYCAARNKRKRTLNLPTKTVSRNILQEKKQTLDKQKHIEKQRLDGPKKTPTIPILNLPNQPALNKKNSDNIEDMPTKKGVPMLNIAQLKRKQSPQGSFKNQQGELGPIISQINKYQQQISIPQMKISSLSFNLKTEPLTSSDHNLQYSHERRMRKLYSSKTLHSEIVLLVISLVLKKGLLDPIYCPQQIINQDRVNILSILHYHLNHSSNKPILSLLAEGVKTIDPYPSGQRLLKLLSTSFINTNLYGQKHKLSQGGSGCTIMTCNTKLQEPKQVVLKQITLSNDLYRCKLTNIFTEITCLDSFRLQPKITDLYDFGVTESAYVIVMKKYTTSLRSWRRELPNNTKNFPNLPLFLNIFKQICLIVKLLHDQNVTHYDIKCDNVLLDYTSQEEMQQGKFHVVFADFGCCKMYQSEKQQFDLMYRGTQVSMSPEMLTVTNKSKKDSDDFDRRKSIGTTRASDIWSLGCLFYELLTGDYLFKNNDVFGRVNNPDGELILKKDLEQLHHNIYLVDFLKFMLVRDPQHRPNIDNVISRFQHIYSLLVPNRLEPYLDHTSAINLNQTLDDLLNNYISQFQKQKEKEKEKEKEKDKEKRVLQNSHPNRGLQKIMKDIYLCDQKYAKNNQKLISKEGITHIVSMIQIPKLPTILIKPGKQSALSIAFRLTPRLSDLIRQVLMFKGKLLLVNNKNNYAVSVLIYILSIWFKCSIYETWCLINTQILQFPFPDDFLPRLSTAFTKLQNIDQQIQTLPKLQCVCCSVTMILRRPLPDIKHDSLMCKCKKKKTECPSGRCYSYLQFLKKRFKIQWEQLIWRKVPHNFFLVGPFKCGQFKDSMKSQILINSADPNQNLVQINSSDSKQWRLYKCKVCEMWMMARHKQGDILIISNTQIKSLRQGIMIPNAQQGYKAKAPLLNQYTLSKLHLIEA